MSVDHRRPGPCSLLRGVTFLLLSGGRSSCVCVRPHESMILVYQQNVVQACGGTIIVWYVLFWSLQRPLVKLILLDNCGRYSFVVGHLHSFVLATFPSGDGFLQHCLHHVLVTLNCYQKYLVNFQALYRPLYLLLTRLKSHWTYM